MAQPLAGWIYTTMTERAATLKLKQFARVTNVGDVASSLVVREVLGVEVEVIGPDSVEEPNLIAIGSILQWSDQLSVVWGAGFISETARLRAKPRAVLAVRGQLSGNRLRDLNVDCPEIYGDPGFLISDIVPSKGRLSVDVGVVPHYVDADCEFVARARASGALVIDPLQPLGDYLAQLACCSCVISSSLHGIVFAHSYGIPAVWIELSGNVLGNGFKFRDYYTSVGVDRVCPVKADATLAHAISRCFLPPQSIDRDALRNALLRGKALLERPPNERKLFQLKPFDIASEEERRSRLAFVDQIRKDGKSEVARWGVSETHRPNWQGRGRLLARYVRPGESVFEFGAGLSIIPPSLSPDCRYTGSDLAPLKNGLLAFDLNAENLRAIEGHDVAMLSGVLEYINDLNKVIDFLAGSFKTIVCSYASASDWSEAALVKRRYSGWVSDDSEATFIARFARAGYSLNSKGVWQGQSLFRFDKRPCDTFEGTDSSARTDGETDELAIAPRMTKTERIVRAKAAQDRSDWLSALANWGVCLREYGDDPASSGWKVAHASALVRLSRFDEAESEFQLLTETPSQLQHALSGLARIAGLQSRWNVAVDRWAVCIERFPQSPALAQWRGARANALLNLGRSEEAEAEFARVAEVDPAQPTGFAGLAQTAMRQTNWRLAEKRWTDCVSRFPDAPAVSNWRRARAVALEKAGEWAAAYEAWRKLAEGQPDDPETPFHLALCCFRSRGPDASALAHLEVAFERKNDDIRALKLRAKIDTSTGDGRVALRCLTKCVESEPFEIEHYVEAIAAADHVGDIPSARRIVEFAPPMLATTDIFVARVTLPFHAMLSDFEAGFKLIAEIDEWELDAISAAAIGSFLHSAHRFEALETVMKRAFNRFPRAPRIVSLYLTGTYRVHGRDRFEALKESLLNLLSSEQRADVLCQLLSSLPSEAEAKIAIDRLFEIEQTKGGAAIAALKFSYRGERDVLLHLRSRLEERDGDAARMAARLISATIEDQERLEGTAREKELDEDFATAHEALVSSFGEFADIDDSSSPARDAITGTLNLGSRAANNWIFSAESYHAARSVALWLADRVQNRTPTSFIRLGDGEGVFLPYHESEAHFRDLDIRSVQQLWWGGIRLTSDDERALSEALREAIVNADGLGVPPPRRLLSDAGRASGSRLLRSLGNIIRNVERLGKLHEKALTSCHVHTDLDQWNLYGRILAPTGSVSVVSCHDLNKVLAEKFRVDIRCDHRVPPEFSFATLFGADATTSDAFFPRVFKRLMEEVAPHPGEPYLVAAGFLGKLLCERIRARGGIGIDIGSVADSWLDFTTRRGTQVSPKGVKPQLLTTRDSADLGADQDAPDDGFQADCNGPYELTPTHTISCWEDMPTTGSEQAVIAALTRAPAGLSGKRVLHIGVGNGELAARMREGDGEYVGVTVSRPEIERFERMFPKSYSKRVLLLNKYDPRSHPLIAGAFDLIVDTTIKGYACCEKHFLGLMDFYSSRLKPGGALVTTALGVNWGWSGNTHRAYTPGAQTSSRAVAGRVLGLASLEALAAQRGLAVREVTIEGAASNPAGDTVLFLDRIE